MASPVSQVPLTGAALNGVKRGFKGSRFVTARATAIIGTLAWVLFCDSAGRAAESNALPRALAATQDQPVVAKSRNDFYNANLNRTMSPKTNIFAGLGYTKFVTEAPTTSSGQSRSVYVGLYHRF